MDKDATRSAVDSGAKKTTHRPYPAQKAGIRRTLEWLWLLASRDDQNPRRISRGHHLEAEVALLREENAYLRMKNAAGPSVGRAIEMIGGLEPETPTADPDDVWQAMVESLVIRDTLIDACRELNAATSQLESRLVALTPQGELFDPEPQALTHGAPGNHRTAIAHRNDKQATAFIRTNGRGLSRQEISFAADGRSA